MRLDLAPPELRRLPATFIEDGEELKATLTFRSFTLADLGWLARTHGADWSAEVGQGNFALAIDILAHQLDDAGDLDVGDDAAEFLKRHIRPGKSAQAVLTTLQQLHEQSMPEVVEAKKRRRLILTLLRSLLVACCIAAVAYWAGLTAS